MTTCLVCHCPNDTWLCRAHLDEFDTALGDMAALDDELTTTLSRQSRTYRANDARVPAEPGWRGAESALRPSPLPIDLHASEVAHDARNAPRDLVRAVVRWVRADEAVSVRAGGAE